MAVRDILGHVKFRRDEHQIALEWCQDDGLCCVWSKQAFVFVGICRISTDATIVKIIATRHASFFEHGTSGIG